VQPINRYVKPDFSMKKNSFFPNIFFLRTAVVVYCCLFIFASPAVSQLSKDSLSDLPFSDFHIHTSFKNYYRYVENPDSTILYGDRPGFINQKYGSTDWIPYVKKPKDKKDGKESNMGNYDQADYANLKGLRGSVLCMSITPPEKIMLASKSERWINYHLVTKMSIKRQEVLADENNSSFKEFMGEYYYAINQDSVHGLTKILVAKNNADLKRIIQDGGIGLVITAEGGHVLFGNEVLSKIKNVKSKDCDTPCRVEILGNIEKLRELPHHVFFITVAHFGWNKMFGNAKSLDKPGLRRDLLTTATLSDDFKKNMFAKYGNGIIGNVRSYNFTDTIIWVNGHRMKITLPYSRDEYRSDIGWQVMRKLLDADHDFKNPIYLDCKHMDIEARFQYYEYVDSVNKIRKAEGKKPIPIIASHIGLSGKRRPVAVATAQYPLSNSYEELIFGPTFYKIQMNDHDLYWRNYTRLLRPEDREIYFGKNEKADLTSFNPFEGTANYNTLGWFYPWEINFCDEEIKYIYASDGIIGLNLDRRILGFTMPNYNWRYRKFLRRKFIDLYGKDHFVLDDGTPINFEDYYIAEPLLRNIFRVVEECGRHDSTAWDHVAIGSDFDGFIQPIQLSPTAESIPLFHRKMVTFVKAFTEIHNEQNMLYGLSAEQVMEKFFYLNGRDFIFRNFQD
jgi:hypothetical protein